MIDIPLDDHKRKRFPWHGDRSRSVTWRSPSEGGLQGGQGLIQVGQEVGSVLNAHGEADEVRGDTGGPELGVVHLAVGGGGGVEHTGLGVGHVGGDRAQLQPGHKPGGGLPASFHTEGDHTAGAAGHILGGQGMIGAALQTGIIDPGDLGMGLQMAGDLHGIGTVLGHPQGEGLQAHIEKVGVHGGRRGAEVPHELSGGLGDVGPGQTELLGVGDAMIALVGGGEAGELVGVGHPVKLAGVHNGPSHGVGVAVHVLGGGVGHDVGPPLKGVAVDGGGKGVVYDEGHAMGVGGLGKALNVQHREGGVGDGLAEDGLGVGAEGGLQLSVGAVGVYKGERHPHALHGDGKEEMKSWIIQD